MNLRIAIIANGEEVQNIKALLKAIDLIIAVDGAADICRSQNVYPDYVIGDLDSISAESLNFFTRSKIIEISRQDNTDLQKALNFANSLNPSLIRIISASGKRTDHSVANLLIFQNYQGKASLEVWDNFGKLFIYGPGSHHLKLKKNSTISFFSLEPIFGLTLAGFKYSLKDRDFKSNFTGVSNVTTSDNCKIEFQKGKLLCYLISE
ncbi:MAG: thiamine diphosphokinase [Candidatus Cloacimonetes bacterium]|nr:thiamine diphosphokinase [Candidatus Cloacimonadota bacterium]